VEVTSPDEEWSASIYTSDTVPEDLAGWGAPKSVGQDVGPQAVFALDPPSRARNVLLWITNLPPESPYRLQVAEVRVIGTD
jgi:hypothetical protein